MKPRQFDQIGSANAFLIYHSRMLGDFWMAPGETIDVYIDGRISGFTASQSRIKYFDGGAYIEENPNPRPANPHGYLYTTGRYSDLNRLSNQFRYADIPDLWDDTKFTYRMTGDEYTDEVERQYHKAVDVINDLGLPQMLKDEMMVNLQLHALELLTSTSHLLYQWDKETNETRMIPYDSLNVRIEERHVHQISNDIDINNPALLMGNYPRSYADAAQLFWNEAKESDAQVRRIYVLGKMPQEADNGYHQVAVNLLDEV